MCRTERRKHKRRVNREKKKMQQLKNGCILRFERGLVRAIEEFKAQKKLDIAQHNLVIFGN